MYIQYVCIHDIKVSTYCIYIFQQQLAYILTCIHTYIPMLFCVQYMYISYIMASFLYQRVRGVHGRGAQYSRCHVDEQARGSIYLFSVLQYYPIRKYGILIHECTRHSTTYIDIYASMYIHTYKHTYITTYIRTYIHTTIFI